MIRKAEIEDKADIIRLLQEFTKSVMGEDIAANEYEEHFDLVMDTGVMLVSDSDGVQGVITGQMIEHPFWRKKMLQEVAWFAKDNSGIALLRAFIKAGKEQEADVIYMTVIESAGPIVHALMSMLKFNPLERSYIMQLT